MTYYSSLFALLVLSNQLWLLLAKNRKPSPEPCPENECLAGFRGLCHNALRNCQDISFRFLELRFGSVDLGGRDSSQIREPLFKGPWGTGPSFRNLGFGG